MGRRVGRMDWQGACHSGGLVGVREKMSENYTPDFDLSL
jgi:hypothetical protein